MSKTIVPGRLPSLKNLGASSLQWVHAHVTRGDLHTAAQVPTMMAEMIFCLDRSPSFPCLSSPALACWSP